MTQHQLVNALRIMNSIDEHELVGVDVATAKAFLIDPMRTFIRADHFTGRAIWAALKARGA